MKACLWCGEKLTEDSKDHVFPRGLGGKLEADLWVPACEECRERISQAETEVIRRTEFALQRYARGVRPRKRKRPTSGLVEPKISLVKNPHTNRYDIFRLRSGEPFPRTLPALEIDPATGQGFIHGAASEDANCLIREINAILSQPPNEEKLLFEISVHRLEELILNIAKDPDFRPRIYLSPRGRLEVCARDAEEAKALIRCLLALKEAGALKPRDPSQWKTWDMPAHTPHQVAFVYEEADLHRVVLKMVYATACVALTRSGRDPLQLVDITQVVRGAGKPPEGMVKELLAGDEASDDWRDHLVTVVALHGERVVGIVGLYGVWFRVDIAPKSDVPEITRPIGAFCQVVSEREQRWFSDVEADKIYQYYVSGKLRPVDT